MVRVEVSDPDTGAIIARVSAAGREAGESLARTMAGMKRYKGKIVELLDYRQVLWTNEE